ncbi:DUF4381 domain-containing protein [Salinicola halimionae]|uniref:DUF4381 domain-containing protein n=1 Tax=Salinicola halimionae TaxID=1949081 RepID=UPI000DA21A08|nr:DUF4381 domain-containing protein [Salinicola halimionae]
MSQQAVAAAQVSIDQAQVTADQAPDGASPPLMLSQMIDQLSPPPEPLPVAWWPQTWGWLAMALVLGGLLLWIGWRWYRHWKANRYRREALAELHRRLAAGEGAIAVADVLRRTALVAFPRQDVASLRGESWGRFLNRTMMSGKASGEACFDAKSTVLLAELPYREPSSAIHQLDDLIRRVERWITRHDAARGATHD